MRKILVLIDGYNFYHKLREFQHRFNRCVKWINYKELMKCYFKDYEDFEFEYIYFSAIAEFKGEDTVTKHKTYIEALKNEGIKIVLGKFKEKTIYRCKCNEKCKNCNNIPDKTPIIKHEEKNTDVNIAITLIKKLTGTKPLFVSWKNILNSQFPGNYKGLQNPWKI